MTAEEKKQNSSLADLSVHPMHSRSVLLQSMIFYFQFFDLNIKIHLLVVELGQFEVSILGKFVDFNGFG